MLRYPNLVEEHGSEPCQCWFESSSEYQACSGPFTVGVTAPHSLLTRVGQHFGVIDVRGRTPDPLATFRQGRNFQFPYMNGAADASRVGMYPLRWNPQA